MKDLLEVFTGYVIWSLGFTLRERAAVAAAAGGGGGGVLRSVVPSSLALLGSINEPHSLLS